MSTRVFPFDIVLLPEPALAERAITLSKQVEPKGVRFTLGSQRILPHVSLYMTATKPTDISKVKMLLQDIAQHTPGLSLSAVKFFQSEGYFDVEYARTPELNKLQETILAAVNPLRQGMGKKNEERLKTATGALRYNLETYGYRSVGELFRPHLTFTRFADETPIDTSSLPKPSTFEGAFTQLALCELGPNGTCVRKLAAFELLTP